VWGSIGASWQVFRGFSFDLAYSHIWVQDPSINITAVSGNPNFNGAINYVGSVNAHVDVLSLAMVYRWGAPEPAPVVKPIIAK
jgi:long-subunit fatty acid transport protein